MKKKNVINIPILLVLSILVIIGFLTFSNLEFEKETTIKLTIGNSSLISNYIDINSEDNFTSNDDKIVIIKDNSMLIPLSAGTTSITNTKNKKKYQISVEDGIYRTLKLNIGEKNNIKEFLGYNEDVSIISPNNDNILIDNNNVLALSEGKVSIGIINKNNELDVLSIIVNNTTNSKVSNTNNTSFNWVTFDEECISDINIDNIKNTYIKNDENPYTANKGLNNSSLFVSPFYETKINNIKVDTYATYAYVPNLSESTLHSFSIIKTKDTKTLNVEIKANIDIKDANILPKSLNTNATVNNNTIYLTINKQGQYTILVNGNDQRYTYTLFVEDDIDEEKEINNYKKNGYQVLEYSGYNSQNYINIDNDNTIVYLRSGSCIVGNHLYSINNNNDENVSEDTSKIGMGGLKRYPFININNKNNIKIIGNGIIDLSKLDWHERKGIVASFTNHIDISRLLLINFEDWSITTYRAENVLIDKVKIFNYRQNTDGIAITNSKEVKVNNSYVRSGDDLFEVKTLGGDENAISDNIVFDNCIGWAPFARGFGITGEVEKNINNVIFKNSAIIYRDAIWDNDGLGALTVIKEKGNGNITNISFDNIEIFHESGRPFNISISKNCTNCSGDIDNITFNNINYSIDNITNESNKSIIAGNKIKNIKFSNITVNKDKWNASYIKTNNSNSLSLYVDNNKINLNHRLIYNNNGGSGCNGKDVINGNEYGSLCIPNRKGYNFIGWFSSKYKDSPLNYYADTNQDLKKEYGYDANKLYNHYINSGKKENKRIAEYIEQDIVNQNDNITVYAGWLPIKYKITYKTNGGTLTNTTTNYTIETNTFNLDTPTRTGYTFTGWYTDSSFTGTKITQISRETTEDKTYYAKWIPITYTISYKLDSDKATHGTYHPTSGTYDKTVRISNPKRTGYKFVGWTSGSVSGLQSGRKIGNNPNNLTDSWTKRTTYEYFKNLRYTPGTVVLTAKWENIKITVRFNKNDGNKPTLSQSFTYGTKNQKFGYDTNGKLLWEQTGQFSNWDRKGYKLLGWSLDKNSKKAEYSVYYSVTDNWIDSNKTTATIDLYAIWTPKKLTVEFKKNDGTNAKLVQEFTYGVKGNKFGYNTNGTPKWEQTGQFGSWDRKDYKLLGWNTNKNATKALYNTYAVAADDWINSRTSSTISLYAIWEKDASKKDKTITVIFNKNDGSGKTVSQKFNSGVSGNRFGYDTKGKVLWEKTGQFGNWDRKDYKLLGWSTKKNDTSADYGVYSEVTNDWINSRTSSTVNLYAIWRKNTVEIPVDLVLLFGQSNMVGYAGHRLRDKGNKNYPGVLETAFKGLTEEQAWKQFKSGIKGINQKILDKSYTFDYTANPDGMKSGVAFEYKELNSYENKLVDISKINNDIYNDIKKNGSNITTYFGEDITYYEQNKKGYLKGRNSSDPYSLESAKGKGTNMIPYFADEYYKKTGHKLVIVHAARAGKPIYSFFPNTECNKERIRVNDKNTSNCEYIYEAIVEKYKRAEKYLKDNNYKINNKFYVVYQGETDSGGSMSAASYYDNFLKVHKYLTENTNSKGLNLSFGALIHTVRYGDSAPSITKDNNKRVYIGKVHDAKVQLEKKYENIMIGTDFVYKEYTEGNNKKGNKTLFVPNPNNMHLHSAALSQVGRNVAITIAESKKIK